jgi:hypothetical protein
MTAHALASAALNEFIHKSNRGGDLQAAYTVLEGHCVNESTRGFTVQVVTLNIGSEEVGYGCSYPENLNDMYQPPDMYIGYLPPLAEESTSGHYVGLLRQAKTVEAIAVAKEGCFYSGIVYFGATGGRPGAKHKLMDTGIQEA